MRPLHDLSVPSVDYWINAYGERLLIRTLTDSHINNILRRTWRYRTGSLRDSMLRAVRAEAEQRNLIFDATHE